MRATKLADADKIAGRYAYLRELGRGATGRVMLVSDTAQGGVRRAAKVVPAAEAERLAWELDALAQVSHPGLAQVFELLRLDAPVGGAFGLESGVALLIEEYVAGRPASEVLDTARAEGDAARALRVCEVGASIASALAALHAVGLVHGDVKPANVLVATRAPSNTQTTASDVAAAPAPAARLVDLGFARPPGTADTVSGTPASLAPEAWLGVRSVGTDLYALGVTLRQLLGASGAASALPAWVPDPLAHVLAGLVAAEPTARPASAREVAAQLAVAAARLEPGAHLAGAEARDAAAVTAGATAAERVMAMGSLPFVGNAQPLAELVAALATPHIVVLCGPPGAGRSRLVREAVREAQRARVTAGGRAPTYLQTPRVPEAAPSYDAIVHVTEESGDELAQAQALLRAASVDATSVTIVLERDAPLAAQAGLSTIALGRLEPGEVRTLCMAALSVRLSDAALDAAISASGGLAGRLCQLLASIVARGADPTRAPTWRTLTEAANEGVTVVLTPGARALAHGLALVGGVLEARVAGKLPGVGDVGSAARELIRCGLATLSVDGRLVLRAEAARAFLKEITAAQRLLMAEAVLGVEPRDELVRGLAEAARGAGDEAQRLLLSAITAARRRGEPETAAHVARLATASLGARAALVYAESDALRALGRYGDARALLAAASEPRLIALRAEIARLMGDGAAARVDSDQVARDAGAEAATLAATHALSARLRLDAGDVAGALSDAERVVRMALPDVSLARAEEINVLASLRRGELAAAAQSGDAAMRAARAAGDLPAEARATGLLAAVAHARGETRAAAVESGRAFELAEAAGEAHTAASFRVNVGLARLDLGELGPAIDALRDGARRLARLGRDSDAARAAYNLGNAAHLAGDDDLALVALRRAEDLAERDVSVVALARVVRSDIARRNGDLTGARAALADLEAPALPAATRAVVAARRGLLLGLAGDVAGAASALAEAEAAGEESGGAPARVEPALARAALALAAGEKARAFELAQRAHELSRGASYELRLRAALLAAEAASGADDDAAAALLMAEARSLLDDAAATLPAASRAAFRNVPEHRRALAATPAASPVAVRSELGPTADVRWRRLAGLAKRLSAERTTARLAGVALDAALELSGAERALFVARERDGSLRVRAFRGLARRGERGEAPAYSRSIVTRVLDEATPLATVDAAADGRLDAAVSVHALALRSVAAVPMRLGDDAAGVLYLDDRLRAGAFGAQDVALLVDLADLASLAFANADSLRRERRTARRLERMRRQLATTVDRQGLELVTLRRSGGAEPLAGLIGASEPMRRVADLASRVAASDVPVLVLGESGVGKELVARAVHDLSARRSGPFISENCGAIPEPLLESTLFGHVRGAFTGADRARQGLFEAANGGTLLLDEIGEMSPAMQTKLLRVLQDGEVRAVGGERTRKVDVRVLAATHRDLEAMVRSGAFREDLYYRLAVMTIAVPPLRARPEDVAPLVAHLVQKHARGREVRVDRRALALLQAYAWPGNVRQLENEVQRALVMATDVIRPEHLSPAVAGGERAAESTAAPIADLDLRAQTDALEQKLIRRALAEHGTQTSAAKALGVSRFGLQKMLKRLGITAQ